MRRSAGTMVEGLIYAEDKERIDDRGSEWTKVSEDFRREVDVEALRRAKETGKHSLSLAVVDSQWSRLEQELLLGRLKSVEAGYDLTGCCMEGTRQSLINEIIAWVTHTPEEKDVLQSNTYWLYGSPGIGKTSLAHSICTSLDDQEHLAGSFFCRRDDPHLSQLKNILPTLINTLAGISPSFRRIVADRLRRNPNLTSRTRRSSLFADFIRALPHHPKHPLVYVIDAFNESGDYHSRPGMLKT